MRKSEQNLKCNDEILPTKKAVASGAIALFDEKYGDTGESYESRHSAHQPGASVGGTHVNATGEIAFFRILAESSVGADCAVSERVTGRAAEELFNRQSASLENIAKTIGARSEEVEAKCPNSQRIG